MFFASIESGAVAPFEVGSASGGFSGIHDRGDVAARSAGRALFGVVVFGLLFEWHNYPVET